MYPFGENDDIDFTISYYFIYRIDSDIKKNRLNCRWSKSIRREPSLNYLSCKIMYSTYDSYLHVGTFQVW